MSDINPVPTDKPSLTLSDTNYNRLKLAAQIFLPGLGALYFALSQIWGLPKGEEIVGTITAVDVFLGLFLSISSRAYLSSPAAVDGSVTVQETPEGEQVMYISDLKGQDERAVRKDKLTLRVRKEPAP